MRNDPKLNVLHELCGIPTASGREDRVVAWVVKWVARRKKLRLTRDEHGNLLITQTEVKSGKAAGRAPVFVTAHLDHPAFVIREILDDGRLLLEFRGGVKNECFMGKEVELFDGEDRVHYGRIVEFAPTNPFRTVIVELTRKKSTLRIGDIGRWRLRGRGGRPVVAKGIFYAPACDDLAGAAAALSVLDVMRRRKGFSHVGVLLTLAEECGFLGAIGAAKSGTVPADARLICLENSRSFPESPIGGGPILRVGDRASVFSPDLTNRLSRILREYERDHPDFRWQCKLMPGGTCEATAFSAFGYQATCACLPLGNYHNQTDASLPEGVPPTAGIGPEYISVQDYLGLISMLRICIEKLDEPQQPMVEVLEKRFADLRHVLPGGT